MNSFGEDFKLEEHGLLDQLALKNDGRLFFLKNSHKLLSNIWN